MTPPRGILPRSVRERYHRSRRAPAEPQSEPTPQSEPATPSGSQPHLGRRMIGTAGLVGAILAVGGVGIVVGSVVSTSGDTDTSATPAGAPARTAAPAKPPTSAPPPTAPATSSPVDRPAKRIRLTAGGSYDPLGDGSEHADLVPLATDGNPSTAWSSEDYQALNKAGVGLFVDPKHAASPTRLTVTTPTPGFSAQVYGAAGATAPKALSGWTKIATVKTVKRVKAVKLDATGRRYTHVLFWITSLPPEGGAVEVSELSLR